MKIFISITAIALIVLLLAMNKSHDGQPGKTINTIMTDGILQSIEEDKKSSCENFVVPIQGTNNTVAFRDDGTVLIRVYNSRQTFNVTN